MILRGSTHFCWWTIHCCWWKIRFCWWKIHCCWWKIHCCWWKIHFCWWKIHCCWWTIHCCWWKIHCCWFLVRPITSPTDPRKGESVPAWEGTGTRRRVAKSSQGAAAGRRDGQGQLFHEFLGFQGNFTGNIRKYSGGVLTYVYICLLWFGDIGEFPWNFPLNWFLEEWKYNVYNTFVCIHVYV